MVDEMFLRREWVPQIINKLRIAAIDTSNEDIAHTAAVFGHGAGLYSQRGSQAYG